MPEGVFREVDEVLIGSKAGIKAGVGLLTDLKGPAYCYLEGQEGVKAVEEAGLKYPGLRLVVISLHVEVSKELGGVHSCICSPAAHRFCFLPEQCREGLVEQLLHGNRVWLDLPSMETGSVIR